MMHLLGARRLSSIILLGLSGWALCGGIMFIGMATMNIHTTLIVHAMGAPIIFVLISWYYFSKFRYTSAVKTAVSFLLIVVLMDFFLVALLINRSLDMFRDLLGTWIPFGLIFLSTYFTGWWLERKQRGLSRHT